MKRIYVGISQRKNSFEQSTMPTGAETK